MNRVKMSLVFLVLALCVLFVPEMVYRRLLKMCDDVANDPDWMEAKRRYSNIELGEMRTTPKPGMPKPGML